tara:strand:- start:972 stop:1301 length:330 start_codon:yes stop_codon:yes gene_type:complete
MFGLKNEEILTCFLLIVVGYCIAKMFSRSCNGFRVGGQINCGDYTKYSCGMSMSGFDCEWKGNKCVSIKSLPPSLPPSPPPSSCRSSGEPCVNNVQCCLGSCTSRGKCM